MVERIEVHVAEPYPVLVGPEPDIGELVSKIVEPGVGVILTDSNVGPLYAEPVKRSLEEAGWRIADVIEVPAGEDSKNLSVYAETIRRMARSGLTRDGTLFALGGGVVGDLGGFVASTYMRGIDFFVLPTSLLAMVDSSVGGKVGVDLPEGKNLVGSFARPQAVIMDLQWLTTLPGKEISCGLAEVIKMSLLAGGEFFEDIELAGKVGAGDIEAARTLVAHSVSFKTGVVAEDEFEGGRREILNYGHTIGHALEAASGYTLSHGDAISAGMIAAARISRSRYGRNLIELHKDLLRAAGLPVKLPGMPVEKIVEAMGRDKKRRTKNGEIGHRFVLLEDIGKPRWGMPVEESEAREAVESVVG